MESLDQAEALLTSRLNTPSGRFRIDLPSAFGRKRVLPILMQMSRQHPELHLTVTFSDRLVDLIEEGIDLAVRIGELSDSSGLIARRLTSQKLVFCASPDYLKANGSPVSLDDINDHHCVVGYRRDQTLSWLVVDDAGQSHRVMPPATHEFGDGDVLLAAALEGMGLAQLPLWLAGEHLADGSLVEVLHGHAGGQTPITAIWPRSRSLLPKVRFLVDHLVAAGDRGDLD